MKVNMYALLEDKIEEGLGWGIRQVFKHASDPKTEEEILDQTDRIMNEIMAKVCEYIEFSDHDDEA